MRDIEVNINDSGQRIDRFLKKYLNNASTSMIQKFLRTKKIKVNRKKVDSSYILALNDVINIFIYEDFFQMAGQFSSGGAFVAVLFTV